MKLFNMKIFTALSLIVFVIVFTNCNETKKVVEDTGSNQLMGTYIITELNDTKVSKDKGMSFEISEFNKSIRGTTGCNSFFGAIAKEGNSLSIIEMSVSEKYCDDVVMKSEQSLMRAFNTTGSYMLKEQILSLYSDSDNSVILIAVKESIQ
jgi:heat shock protein HslJ